MIISVRGHEFEHTPYDLDERAHVKVAEDHLKSRLLEIGASEGDSNDDQLELMYKAYEVFFDVALEKGSLATILGGKRNTIEAIAAYYELRNARLDAMGKRAVEVAMMAAIPDQYNPDKIRK